MILLSVHLATTKLMQTEKEPPIWQFPKAGKRLRLSQNKRSIYIALPLVAHFVYNYSSQIVGWRRRPTNLVRGETQQP